MISGCFWRSNWASSTTPGCATSGPWRIRKKALGPAHPDVANTLSNLGLLNHGPGSFGSPDHLRRALGDRGAGFRPDNSNVAETLSNLGDSYPAVRRLRHPLDLYSNVALGVYEQTLGLEHPNVAQTLYDLGFLYRNIGDFARAQTAVRTFADDPRKETLGREHPRMGDTLWALAMIHHYRGNAAEAKSLFERSLAIAEQTQRADHNRSHLLGLATVYASRGELVKAESYYSRAETMIGHGGASGSIHPQSGLG